MFFHGEMKLFYVSAEMINVCSSVGSLLSFPVKGDYCS